MSDKPIKIFVKGVRRVGNNFLMALLRRNLKRVKVIGSTHQLPKWEDPKRFIDSEDKAEKYVVGIIKNPYSWFLSIDRWAKSSWGTDWQSANWRNNWKMYKELYEEFNDFYNKLWTFSENYSNYGEYYKGCLLIRYEELLAHTEENIKEMSNTFNVNTKVEKIIIPDVVPQSTKFTKHRRQFYLSKGTFGLSKKLIDKINQCVDWDLMSNYGYEICKGESNGK